MGHKIHPVGVRIGIIQEPNTYWFANSSNYSGYIKEDYFIREYIQAAFLDANVTGICIQRTSSCLRITVSSPDTNIFKATAFTINSKLKFRQNSILKSRFGNKRFKNPKQLIKHLNNKQLNRIDAVCEQLQYHLKRQIMIDQVVSSNLQASVLAKGIVEQLEKRIAFKKAARQVLKKVQIQGDSEICGVKIQLSGRLNGIEMARSETIKEGRMPLQTLRANIDYSYQHL